MADELSASPSKIPAIRPGHEVARRYRIDHRVGQGGGGEVYRATDLKLERVVGLKRILGGDPDTRVRSAGDEARIVARLEHTSIPRVYDLIVDEGELWFITSFVEGRSLYRILREGERWSFSTAMRVLRELGEVLKFAHGRRIAHSDIKPSNILVGDDGAVTLTDFGVARVLTLERGKRPGPAVLKGTEGYLAPEIYDADPRRLDFRQCARWDLYALGVVFYNLLVLDMPTDVNPESVSLEVAKGLKESVALDPPSPTRIADEVPDSVRSAVTELITRCMEVDPAKRIQSADEFLQGLDRIQALYDAKPVRKSFPVGLAVALALGTLLAGAAIGYFLPH
ncbi:MAG: serine/threonine-protein kinase [bacterium]